MLYPLNKYLVVEPVEDDPGDDTPSVLVPAGVEVAMSRFALVRLVEASAGSNLQPGMLLAVHSHMVEKADLKGETYYLLLESQVVGFLGE